MNISMAKVHSRHPIQFPVVSESTVESAKKAHQMASAAELLGPQHLDVR